MISYSCIRGHSKAGLPNIEAWGLAHEVEKNIGAAWGDDGNGIQTRRIRKVGEANELIDNIGCSFDDRYGEHIRRYSRGIDPMSSKGVDPKNPIGQKSNKEKIIKDGEVRFTMTAPRENLPLSRQSYKRFPYVPNVQKTGHIVPIDKNRVPSGIGLSNKQYSNLARNTNPIAVQEKAMAKTHSTDASHRVSSGTLQGTLRTGVGNNNMAMANQILDNPHVGETHIQRDQCKAAGQSNLFHGAYQGDVINQSPPVKVMTIRETPNACHFVSSGCIFPDQKEVKPDQILTNDITRQTPLVISGHTNPVGTEHDVTIRLATSQKQIGNVIQTPLLTQSVTGLHLPVGNKNDLVTELAQHKVFTKEKVNNRSYAKGFLRTNPGYNAFDVNGDRKANHNFIHKFQSAQPLQTRLNSVYNKSYTPESCGNRIIDGSVKESQGSVQSGLSSLYQGPPTRVTVPIHNINKNTLYPTVETQNAPTVCGQSQLEFSTVQRIKPTLSSIGSFYNYGTRVQ